MGPLLNLMKIEDARAVGAHGERAAKARPQRQKINAYHIGRRYLFNGDEVAEYRRSLWVVRAVPAWHEGTLYFALARRRRRRHTPPLFTKGLSQPAGKNAKIYEWGKPYTTRKEAESQPDSTFTEAVALLPSKP